MDSRLAKITLLMEQQRCIHPINKTPIKCGCGDSIPLRFMQKCYYCEEYFCNVCACKHFGKSRAQAKQVRITTIIHNALR